MTIEETKSLSYRPQDLVYDPLFVVCGPKDHLKAEIIAKMAMAKFQICPVFSSMFSDLSSYPRKQLVLRKPRTIPSYKEQKKNVDQYFKKLQCQSDHVHGRDRCKYIFSKLPVVTYPSEVIPAVFPSFGLKEIEPYSKEARKTGKMSRKVQTDYRDSDMQTSPWQPNYKLMDNGTVASPRILKLDFLKWGSGLPAGRNEIILMERARMKRAWEKQLPPPANEELLEKRRDIIEALERDEWAFREHEIQEIQELRLKLLENMLTELHQKAADRGYRKLKNLANIKRSETNEKISKLRHKTAREIRKLDMKHRGIKTDYEPINVVEDLTHPKSELYAPLIRHGEHPMRTHVALDERLKYYKAQFIGVENFSTLPRWIKDIKKMKFSIEEKSKKVQLCVRDTKWTAPVLKDLYEELKNLRKPTKTKCSLRVKIEKEESEAATSEAEGLPDDEEVRYQTILNIQSILKGRATQMMIYEGRNKCRELIHELKYSTGLLEEQKERLAKEEERVKIQKEQEANEIKKLSTLRQSLSELEGTVVGSLLDFLNKELRRLLDERKAHAICFLHERERADREAAEAGRRQKERRRRREHDEIFKQIVKVHQDTVDLYLQDIITEGINFASEEEAKKFIREITNDVDRDNMEELENSVTSTEQEEVIADLVHHFVLPEVQKQMVRERIEKKQKAKLKIMNELVLDELFIDSAIQAEEEYTRSSGSSGSFDFHFEYKAQQDLIEKVWGTDEVDPIKFLEERFEEQDVEMASPGEYEDVEKQSDIVDDIPKASDSKSDSEMFSDTSERYLTPESAEDENPEETTPVTDYQSEDMEEGQGDRSSSLNKSTDEQSETE